MAVSDQKTHWNQIHGKGGMEEYSHKPTDFAKEVIGSFPPKSKVLELGCGLGNDSVFFAEKEHSVVGTDFADVAVQQDSKRYEVQKNLQFKVLDMTQSFPFNDQEFDVVYARLSLHYFTDAVTKKVFREIHRVLKKGGLLCFVCKSTEDPLYGQGEELEKDMFSRGGHVRHFFSEQYAKECLQNKFKIEKMEAGKEKFYGDESGYVKVIAESIV